MTMTMTEPLELDMAVSSTDVLYLGWSGKLNPAMLAQPTLTQTEQQKDPATQQQLIAKKRLAAIENAGACSFAFGLSELVVLRGDSATPVFSRKKNAAVAFVQWLTKEYEGYFGRWLTSTPTNLSPGVTGKRGVAFIGFDVRTILRAIAMEVHMANAAGTGLPTEVPVRMWYSVPNAYDTLDLLAPSTQQKLLDMPAALRSLGISEALCTPEAWQDPIQSATLSRLVAQRLQLFSME